jgi:hypothetical protein
MDSIITIKMDIILLLNQYCRLYKNYLKFLVITIRKWRKSVDHTHRMRTSIKTTTFENIKMIYEFYLVLTQYLVTYLYDILIHFIIMQK